jgi:hypothetical protein
LPAELRFLDLEFSDFLCVVPIFIGIQCYAFGFLGHWWGSNLRLVCAGVRAI